MIDFLDSTNYKWTNKKNAIYEKWKENLNKGIVDFIEDDDYQEFERRFAKEMELQCIKEEELREEIVEELREEVVEELREEIVEELIEETEINRENIIVNKEQKTNNHEKKISFWLFIFFLCGLISLHFPKKNWFSIHNHKDNKLMKNIDNNFFSRFYKHMGK